MTGLAIRKIITTGTVLLTFVALTIGVADRGETTEQTQDELCESAVWQMIPATCLSRQDTRNVYPERVPLLAGELGLAAQRTSELSSQARSEKADRLEPIEIGSAAYRTVETRTNSGSILTRIKIDE